MKMFENDCLTVESQTQTSLNNTYCMTSGQSLSVSSTVRPCSIFPYCIFWRMWDMNQCPEVMDWAYIILSHFFLVHIIYALSCCHGTCQWGLQTVFLGQKRKTKVDTSAWTPKRHQRRAWTSSYSSLSFYRSWHALCQVPFLLNLYLKFLIKPRPILFGVLPKIQDVYCHTGRTIGWKTSAGVLH